MKPCAGKERGSREMNALSEKQWEQYRQPIDTEYMTLETLGDAYFDRLQYVLDILEKGEKYCKECRREYEREKSDHPKLIDTITDMRIERDKLKAERDALINYLSSHIACADCEQRYKLKLGLTEDMCRMCWREYAARMAGAE